MDIKESQKKSPEDINKNLSKDAIEELGSIKESVEEEKPEDLVESNYYTGGLTPILKNYIPEGLELTQQELVSVQQGMRRLSSGLRAAIPIKCYGNKCPFKTQCPFFKIEKAPFGKNCHVPGELIKTSCHGDIKIENLDPKVHTLVSYNRRRGAILGDNGDSNNKPGRSFKRTQREYDGLAICLHTKDEDINHKVTGDHISIARFNEKALNKFCVYLMRKDEKYRVGKTKLLNYNERSGKFSLPFAGRLKKEQADDLWILKVCDTNTEALLEEEKFSCFLRAPKALFVATSNEYKNNMKQDGLYRWVSQEQLDDHHNRFLKPACYWAEKLGLLNLSIEHPFISKDNSEKTYDDIKVYAKRSMNIRACNLLQEVMDVPVYIKDLQVSESGRYKLVNWEELIHLSKSQYKGTVYSLDVEKDKTYFANNIATHNCPVESMLMDVYTKRYLDEFEVRSEDMSEVASMTMLAATHVMEMRAFMILGRESEEEEGNPDGFIKNVVGFNNNDEPIVQMQEHPAFNQVERAWRWRRNLLESMVGTRREKYKKNAALKERTADSSSYNAADLKSKIDKLRVIDVSED